jgi:hypothetical protein
MSSYTIIGFDESNGSLQIKYAENMAPISVDVPIRNNAYIVGEELDIYVQGFIPTWHLERINAIQQGVANVVEIKNLVQEQPVANVSTIETPSVSEEVAAWEQQAFEDSVNAVLVKHGLISGS